VPHLFAPALFLSALLLFVIQPVVGKMLLPLLGGTPAVWTVCMTFFQAVLLGGYLYAHLSIQALGPRRQAALHMALLALPLTALAAWVVGVGSPIGVLSDLVTWAEQSPVTGLPLLLLTMVGLPAFALSASAPMLQRWYAATGAAGARDPYILYAASNAGSLGGLAAFPLVLEPNLRLGQLAWVWAGGFVVLVVLTGLCALPLRAAPPTADAAGAAEDLPALPWHRRPHWLLLAMVPSALMLGVTTYFSIDVAPVPLLWIVPLALYLVTFIVAFARPPRVLMLLARLLSPLLLLLVVFLMASGTRPPLAVTLGLHLAAFTGLALVLHGELARLRPEPARLTEYYLWVSLGGVLGGLFAAASPLMFPGVWEYPIALAAAVLLMPALGQGWRWFSLLFDGLAPLVVVGICAGLLYVVEAPASDVKVGPVSLTPTQVRLLVCYGIPVMLAAACLARPLRFALVVAGIGLVALAEDNRGQGYLFRERSFFAVVKVYNYDVTVKQAGMPDRVRPERWFVHGTTIHGIQHRGADGETPSPEPVGYFDRAGPVGDIYRVFSGDKRKKRVAVMGLGCGTMAAYAESPDQQFDFYEIDPVVIRVATDRELFTFLPDCKAKTRMIVGDARRRLEQNTDARYGLIFADAFSSDSVPVHLITREAVQLYFDRLEPDGVVALHISNRNIDLEPMLAALARDLNLVARKGSSDADDVTGRYATTWVVLARDASHLGPLAEEPWEPLTRKPHVRAWTDDFSNLLDVIDWGKWQ
jgi:hypothetical protein